MGIMSMSANIIAQVKPSQCLKFNFIDISTIPPSSALEYINFAAATNNNLLNYIIRNVVNAVVLYLYVYD